MSFGPATRPQRASPADPQQFSRAPQSTLIGQLLVRDGWITKTQLDYALALQPSWGSRLGDIVLALGWMRALDFHQVLARHFGLAFVTLSNNRRTKRYSTFMSARIMRSTSTSHGDCKMAFSCWPQRTLVRQN